MAAISNPPAITHNAYIVVANIAREGLAPALCKMAGAHNRMKYTPSRLRRLIAQRSSVVGVRPYRKSAATGLRWRRPGAVATDFWQPKREQRGHNERPNAASDEDRRPAENAHELACQQSADGKPNRDANGRQHDESPGAISGAKSAASVMATGMPPPSPNPVRNRRPAN